MTPTQIAHYRITAKLGEGGMGAVYRATDTKLNRDVAIKILPEAFASDPDRFARFTREAQLLAALNHPSIAAIYGIEDRAIVMELIEGPTLEDRIAQGALPLDEALAIARQIAEALETAHDKGIVHRDLKPANIKLTPDAKVKVLDFGLAKLHDPRDPSEDPASAPTILRGNSPTISGMIMGTAEYMSPEQAAGKPVDKRADIWSFGVVLYEMLTARRLFQAETVSHTLADVLRAPIDLTPAPAAIRPLLARCLDRNPKTRLRDIGEARFALDHPPTAPDAATPPPPPPRKPSLLPWLLAATFAASAATLAFLHFRPTPPPPAVRFQILGDNAYFRLGAEISPDGKFIVYKQVKDGQSSLWLRSLNSTQPKRLHQEPSLGLNNYPFWSPDSRWIAFAAGNKLKKIDVTADSPSPIVICECIANTGSFRGGAWSPDGTILFTPTTISALSRVPAAGGAPTPVTTLRQDKEILHRWPHFLPDSRHFLFYIGSGDPAHAGVYLASLDNPTPKRLLDSESHATFVPSSPGGTSGHLLFTKDDSLRAVPFDTKKLSITGEPVVLATSTRQLNSRGPFSASQNGIIAYWQGEPFPPVQLNWYNRDGKHLRSAFSGTLPRGSINGLDLSQDGKSLVAGLGTTFGGANRVYSIDLEQSSLSPLGSENQRGISPIWLPGPRRIAFGHGSDGPFMLSELFLDRPFAPQRLHTTTQNAYARSISSDGSVLIFEVDFGSKRETWAFSMSDRKAYPWIRDGRIDVQAQLAPGATNPFWLAYNSNESGADQIYTESFTLDGQRTGRVQLSSHGGADPRWRPDGRELFFLAPGNKLMVASVLPNRQFARPTLLFQTPTLASGTVMRGHRYAVSPDGQSFLFVTPGEQSTEPLTVLLNWQSELPR